MVSFRNVIRRLLAHEVRETNEVLSLEEMLAEGATDTFKNRYNVREKLQTSLQQVRYHVDVIAISV